MGEETKTTTTRSEIELVSGDDAAELFNNEDFLKEWDSLYHLCPWKTIFQAKEFVLSWYKIFGEHYAPIIITKYEEGRLVGLFTLAKGDNTHLITGAGNQQAEYHTWLCSAADSDAFIQQAFDLVHGHFPRHNILLRYLPPQTPTSWVHTSKRWKHRAILRTMKQPLIELNEDLFTRKLNAKTIREKTKRLERLGALRLERITAYEQFESILDELITHYEFRKGATYNVAPFKAEPEKKALLLELFKKDLLDVSLLTLNDQIIAFTVNTTDKNTVTLKGLNAHVPFYSKQSPGLLHLLMLGRLLSSEGAKVFDLTPGDDVYKDKLATNQRDAVKLWVVNNQANYLKVLLTERIRSVFINRLKQKGVDPRVILNRVMKARDNLIFAKRVGIGRTVMKLTSHLFPTKKKHTYIIKPGQNQEALKLNRDSLADLLLFDAKGSRITRWEFLSDAMKRFELGEHSFTLVEGGCLLGCAWLKGKYSGELKGAEGAIPPGESAVVHGVYSHRSLRARLHPFLNAVAEEVSSMVNKPEVYLVSEIRKKRMFANKARVAGTSPGTINDTGSYFQ